MKQPLRLDPQVSRRLWAGGVSALIHAGLIVLLFSAEGRFEGLHESETALTQLILIESPDTQPSDGGQASETLTIEKLAAPELPSAPAPALPEVEPASNPAPPVTDAGSEAADAMEALAVTIQPQVPVSELPMTLVSAEHEKATLTANLARLAEELLRQPRKQLQWEQDGKVYQAALVMQSAGSGADFDRVVAEVSAQSHGRMFTTRIRFKRLSFSHYTQLVDRWDPWVQLHDDRIVGRFHVNSHFNLLYDGHAVPQFLGKVTTASNNYTAQAMAKRRHADIFRGGIETGVSPVTMPEASQPFEWAPREEKARIHEIATHTGIRFFPDGSYALRDRKTDAQQYVNEPTRHPVYFIAGPDVTLYVEGTVSGRMLVYSPQRIVIEGHLRYATDPREHADCSDYLGLVSDRDVEIASAYVTGRGDLDIHAAIYAGRRFEVRDIEQRRTALLTIYGSLAAGSLSATEPRYATKIEYDSRFEYQRPPGFPSTNHFAAEEWDGEWIEASL